MENDFQQVHAYKPIMAGLLTGIVATVLNIFYDILYRESSGFPLTVIINIATLIFGTLLLFTLAGTVFAVIDKYTRHSTAIYTILFVVLTLLGVYFSLHVKRSESLVLTTEFHHLLLGITIISGSTASFLIPYLAKHETDYI